MFLWDPLGYFLLKLIFVVVNFPGSFLNQKSKALGCSAHTDYGLISLLHQTAPGLQVLHAEDNVSWFGLWMAVGLGMRKADGLE